MIAAFIVVYDRIYDEKLKKKVSKYTIKERIFVALAWMPKGNYCLINNIH